MATLQELRGLFTNSDLMEKVEAALLIAIQDVLAGTPTANDMRYAAHAFDNPSAEARKALMSVLAVNNAATVGQITSVSDATIKSNVADAVTVLSAAWVASNP